MKIQYHLLLFLTLLFSSNLFAIKTGSNIETIETERGIRGKEKPVRTFSQKIIQRILKKKVVGKFRVKNSENEKSKLGNLSVMFSILVFLSILLSPKKTTIVVFGILFGLIGLLLGILGMRKENYELYWNCPFMYLALYGAQHDFGLVLTPQRHKNPITTPKI